MPRKRRSTVPDARREVAPPEGFEDMVLDEFRAASDACLDGVYMLLEELETLNPDPNERCGLLAGVHEVYAMNVPGCPRLRLLVSIDHLTGPAQPCFVHGLVAKSFRPCDTALQRAQAQLDLPYQSGNPAS